MSAEGKYIGHELELFAHATNWKRYWQSKLAPYVKGRVLEVGGGMGANTPFFVTADALTVLEPDAAMAAEIAKSFPQARVLSQTLQGLEGSFDSIFYIDVLEHIEDDAGELRAACEHLNRGGNVVVLSPAYPSLYSPFDRSIGHYRRYTAKSLGALTPAGARLRKVFYLDSAGSAASFANKLLLKQSLPTLRQIHFWDRVLVPLSRLFDPLLAYRFGKTVIAVFEKE